MDGAYKSDTPVFDQTLEDWVEEWDKAASHVRGMWGRGFKGELMLAAAICTTTQAIDIVEGTIVEGTAVHDRPTTELPIRPTPKQLAGSKHPATRVKMGKPGGS